MLVQYTPELKMVQIKSVNVKFEILKSIRNVHNTENSTRRDNSVAYPLKGIFISTVVKVTDMKMTANSTKNQLSHANDSSIPYTFINS